MSKGGHARQCLRSQVGKQLQRTSLERADGNGGTVKIRIRLKSQLTTRSSTNRRRRIVETVTERGRNCCWPRSAASSTGKERLLCYPFSSQKYKGFSRALRDAHSQAPHRHRGPDPKAVDSLMHIDLPADVNIENQAVRRRKHYV